LQKFRGERMPPGATSLETFADFRDWKASHPDEAENYQRQFDGAAALKFLKEPKTSKEVRNLAFAYFTPDEFPTHRMLQELMMLDPMGAERDQIMEIATLILRVGLHPGVCQGTQIGGGLPHHEPRAEAHHDAAARDSEAERLRGSRSFPRHSGRTGNRSGKLRSTAEIQLLEHLHRTAVCALQTKPHPLGCLRKLPSVFHHAAE
jgi:hypothetical protein